MLLNTAFSLVTGHFRPIPEPQGDLTGKTVIITGSNVGLGLDAARYFVRLGCARLILACRNLEKAEAARQDIIDTHAKKNGGNKPVTEILIWQLDLSDLKNTKAFSERCAKELDRIDYFMANASLADSQYNEAEGWEMQLLVNVISTFYLNVLMLPVLRQSASKHGITPRICVTASAACFLAFFNERKNKDIFQSLKENKSLYDRYNCTKLLQVILTKHLAVAARASGRGPDVIINCFHPGLCRTDLWRFMAWPAAIPFNAIMWIVGRSSDMGSRTLLCAALSDESDETTATHGRYMNDGKPADFPPIMQGDEGEQMQSKVWEEYLEILDGIEPGLSKTI